MITIGVTPWGLAIASVAALNMALGAALPPPTSTQPPAGLPASVTAAATPLTTNGSWPVYHHDDAGTGYDSNMPGAASAATGWVSTTVDQAVYGEPLVYQGVVYVATLNNTVYALNQTDGSVVWSVNLGAPQTSGWQCGNVNPTGTLGTGVIDAAAGRIYFAPFLHQYLAYYLYGLNLSTGAIAMRTQIKLSGFDWTIQQQRGALAVSRDGTHVYVPFGGRAGDCGPYRGWVVGVPTNGSPPNELYKTPTTAEGIWAAGGVVIDDSTGNVFFATGNAIPCSGAVNSDSVIRTTATLASPTFFQPQDWSAHWCAPDLDLGSASPIILSPSLMFASGKYGQGFLLNAASLGGTNGQLFPARMPYVGADVCHGIHSDATFGSFAYAAPYVYLECDNGGLEALQVSTSAPSFSPAWNAGGSTTFGPPIVAGGVVWAVDIGGTGLYGFDATTGAQIYHSASFGVAHFSTPSEAGGQIFVSAGNRVREFDMTFCTSAGLSPGTANQPAGSTVAFTASSTGCASPEYEFWVQYPGGKWYLKQGWGGATFNWDTTGLAPGVYTVHAWVNARGTGHDAIGSATVTLTGCTSASVSPPNPTQPAGSTVALTATSSGCPNPIYEFWVQYPGGTWYLKQGWGGPTFSWDTTGVAPGVYTVHAWANQQGAAATLEVYGTSTVTLTRCTSASLSPASVTQPAGSTVALTASSTGCLNPQYEFWVQYPGGAWYLKQGWGGATFNWDTTGLPPGVYTVHAWVNRSGTTWEAIGSATVTLTGCTSASLNPTNPTQLAGSSVAFTTTSGGCPNPIYEFWVQYPGGTWYLKRGWGGPTFSWDTTGVAPGVYTVHAWANQQGAAATLEVYGTSTVTLTGCTSAALSPASGSSSAGSTITFTASATGCTNPTYEFWLLDPSGRWHLMRGYSTTATWSWNSAGWARGRYTIHVWANQQGASLSTYEVIGSATHSLS